MSWGRQYHGHPGVVILLIMGLIYGYLLWLLVTNIAPGLIAVGIVFGLPIFPSGLWLSLPTIVEINAKQFVIWLSLHPIPGRASGFSQGAG